MKIIIVTWRKQNSVIRAVFPLLLFLFLSHGPATAQTPDTSRITGERPPELTGKLQAAVTAKGPDYQPGTKHLLADGTPRFTNRLVMEDSPYLLQHAHNPVDWYPWSTEAFARAAAENKPVFLSIGYSTCHWCHVMERESFENLDIASFMNTHFVPIKVDRERRPDVDLTYMTGVQLITGGGGWPLNSFLTPGGKTFFGGTYYPPDRFMRVLQTIAAAWDNNNDELLEQANLISGEVEKIMQARQDALAIDDAVIRSAVDGLLSRFDAVEGGFSISPKFPNEPVLFLLFDAAVRYRRTDTLDAALLTLRKMAMGGIHDQIGGGFHRYATDGYWQVPHFEKMLYNQANLGRLYVTAGELTGDPVYARIARDSLDYVLRELTDPAGGFYSATDADSEGKEGKYFVWTTGEVRKVLGKDAGFALEIFGMTGTGNFNGANIPHLPVTVDDYAVANRLPLEDVLDRIDSVRSRLLQARQKRVPPLRDQKIVTAWNGMMITALAAAGRALDEARYLNAAVDAAEYIWRTNLKQDGTLWRSSLSGSVSVPAAQEDFAWYATALAELYDVTGDMRWLKRAETITGKMLALFWDDNLHGFFMNDGRSDVPLMVRPKDIYDSASPSGNAVALRLLAKLAKRTGDNSYENYAAKTLAAFSSGLSKQPDAFPYMVLAGSEFLYRELGPQQYAARGSVVSSASIRVRNDNLLVLDIDLLIKSGWHINASTTLEDDLVPTRVMVNEETPAWQVIETSYPDAEIKKPGFSKTELALYEGTPRIRLLLKRTASTVPALPLIPVVVTLQACNDKICLPPEELTLDVPVRN